MFLYHAGVELDGLAGGCGAVGVDGAHPEGGGEAHDEEEGGEGPEFEVLAGGEVPAGDFFGADAELAVEDALDHPEHVGRRRR